MNWLKENWTDILLFLWASMWTAGGIYFAVDVVIENQRVETFSQVLEISLFLNLAVFIVYGGFTTQIRLFKDWKK